MSDDGKTLEEQQAEAARMQKQPDDATTTPEPPPPPPEDEQQPGPAPEGEKSDEAPKDPLQEQAARNQENEAAKDTSAPVKSSGHSANQDALERGENPAVAHAVSDDGSVMADPYATPPEPVDENGMTASQRWAESPNTDIGASSDNPLPVQYPDPATGNRVFEQLPHASEAGGARNNLDPAVPETDTHPSDDPTGGDAPPPPEDDKKV